jgi:hypothetical protein
MDQERLHYYEQLRTSLTPLRRLITEDNASASDFDEFLEHNEFGLALLTICDSLLEREEISIEECEMEAIEVLHGKMQMNDERASQLRGCWTEFCNRARL